MNFHIYANKHSLSLVRYVSHIATWWSVGDLMGNSRYFFMHASAASSDAEGYPAPRHHDDSISAAAAAVVNEWHNS